MQRLIRYLKDKEDIFNFTSGTIGMASTKDPVCIYYD